MSDDSSELSKVKRRLMKLDINSLDEQMSSSGKKYESPKSHKTLKKRRFRLLETHDVGEDIFSSSVESSSQKGGASQLKAGSQKIDRKSLKLNEKMLKKASATVDLISQKVKG